MTNTGGEKGKNGAGPNARPDAGPDTGSGDVEKSASLDDFSRRLEAARGKREKTIRDLAVASTPGAARDRSLGAGFRLASELLASVIVGLALGLGADAVMGWSPFGLLAGLFVGFAAGFRNAAAAFTRSDDPADAKGEKGVDASSVHEANGAGPR